MQRGSEAGHSAAMSQRALHFIPLLAESVQSALAQSASPEQESPGRPVPRAPGTQKTFAPLESCEWQ